MKSIIGFTQALYPVLCLFLFLNMRPAGAATYYVSTGGDDDASGLAPATAWATVGKVNAGTYVPGDSILFERGGTWRNAVLRMTSSGNATSQITYGAYGTGDRPGIFGSTGIRSWTQVSGQIWAADTTVPNNPRTIDYGAQIFFRETDGSVSWGHYETHDAAFSNLTDDYDWTWNNDTVYIHSSTDPNTAYAGAEAPQLQQIVQMRDHSYVTFDSLAILFAVNAGIYDQYATVVLNGLRVTNCDIGYIGYKGSGSAYGLTVHQSDAYYAYNDIHHCGRRSISLTTYDTSPITMENIVIEGNHFHDGYHTTGVDAILGGTHTLQNVTIRGNLFRGNPDEDIQAEDNATSNHIFIKDGSSGGYIGNIDIYGNVFTYAHASAVKIEYVGDINIINNTFYGFNLTIANYQALVYTAQPPGPITVKNNIFYNNTTTTRLTALKVDSGYEDQLDIDYNLYYHVNSDTRLYWCNGGTHYTMDEWDTYQSATGFDAHSPDPVDPGFVSPPADFTLAAGSVALGAGTAIAGFDTDYYGNTMSSPPDLGAVQDNGSRVAFSAPVAAAPVFSVSPNPLTAAADVTVDLTDRSDVRITVLDAAGGERAVLLDGRLGKGMHTVPLNVGSLEAGTYFIRTQINARSFVRRCVVAR